MKMQENPELQNASFAFLSHDSDSSETPPFVTTPLFPHSYNY
jgi:hypothetical protein